MRFVYFQRTDGEYQIPEDAHQRNPHDTVNDPRTWWGGINTQKVVDSRHAQGETIPPDMEYEMKKNKHALKMVFKNRLIDNKEQTKASKRSLKFNREELKKIIKGKEKEVYPITIANDDGELQKYYVDFTGEVPESEVGAGFERIDIQWLPQTVINLVKKKIFGIDDFEWADIRRDCKGHYNTLMADINATYQNNPRLRNALLAIPLVKDYIDFLRAISPQSTDIKGGIIASAIEDVTDVPFNSVQQTKEALSRRFPGAVATIQSLIDVDHGNDEIALMFWKSMWKAATSHPINGDQDKFNAYIEETLGSVSATSDGIDTAKNDLKANLNKFYDAVEQLKQLQDAGEEIGESGTEEAEISRLEEEIERLGEVGDATNETDVTGTTGEMRRVNAKIARYLNQLGGGEITNPHIQTVHRRLQKAVEQWIEKAKEVYEAENALVELGTFVEDPANAGEPNIAACTGEIKNLAVERNSLRTAGALNTAQRNRLAEVERELTRAKREVSRNETLIAGRTAALANIKNSINGYLNSTDPELVNIPPTNPTGQIYHSILATPNHIVNIATDTLGGASDGCYFNSNQLAIADDLEDTTRTSSALTPERRQEIEDQLEATRDQRGDFIRDRERKIDKIATLNTKVDGKRTKNTEKQTQALDKVRALKANINQIIENGVDGKYFQELQDGSALHTLTQIADTADAAEFISFVDRNDRELVMDTEYEAQNRYAEGRKADIDSQDAPEKMSMTKAAIQAEAKRIQWSSGYDEQIALQMASTRIMSLQETRVNKGIAQDIYYRYQQRAKRGFFKKMFDTVKDSIKAYRNDVVTFSYMLENFASLKEGAWLRDVFPKAIWERKGERWKVWAWFNPSNYVTRAVGGDLTPGFLWKGLTQGIQITTDKLVKALDRSPLSQDEKIRSLVMLREKIRAVIDDSGASSISKSISERDFLNYELLLQSVTNSILRVRRDKMVHEVSQSSENLVDALTHYVEDDLSAQDELVQEAQDRMNSQAGRNTMNYLYQKSSHKAQVFYALQVAFDKKLIEQETLKEEAHKRKVQYVPKGKHYVNKQWSFQEFVDDVMAKRAAEGKEIFPIDVRNTEFQTYGRAPLSSKYNRIVRNTKKGLRIAKKAAKMLSTFTKYGTLGYGGILVATSMWDKAADNREAKRRMQEAKDAQQISSDDEETPMNTAQTIQAYQGEDGVLARAMGGNSALSTGPVQPKISEPRQSRQAQQFSIDDLPDEERSLYQNN